MVVSLDGRSTKKDPSDKSWISDEDQEYFYKEIIEQSKLLIMGSTTYNGAKNVMKHEKGRKRIIITSSPSQYEKEKIEGILEFTNEYPDALISRLESEGYNEAFLLGGAYTNTDFFRKKLVNQVWLTLEPKILGIGNGIVTDHMDVNLELIESRKINSKGTLLLKYFVNY